MSPPCKLLQSTSQGIAPQAMPAICSVSHVDSCHNWHWLKDPQCTSKDAHGKEHGKNRITISMLCLHVIGPACGNHVVSWEISVMLPCYSMKHNSWDSHVRVCSEQRDIGIKSGRAGFRIRFAMAMTCTLQPETSSCGAGREIGLDH